MYGLVNRAIEELVTQIAGEASWAAVRRKAEIDEAAFVSMQAYPDALTYDLIGAASEVLGEPVDALLQAFGRHWILFTGQEGYGPLMGLAGNSLAEFVQNLDGLHGRISIAMPELEPPSFRASVMPDGRIVVEYQSHREGLEPMVVGLLYGLAERFDEKVRIEQRYGAEVPTFEIVPENAPTDDA